MRFVFGLFIGMFIGAAAVYLALQPPWRGEDGAIAQADAGAASASAQEGPKPRKRRRRPRPDGDPIPSLTAADRKLVWQGPAVALPDARVDFGADEGGRPLSAGEINQTIAAQSSRLISCITEARGNAPLEAEIILEMLVGPDGRVHKARVRAPAYLLAHGFYACARRAARALGFPATGAHTVARAPFNLH